MSQVKEVNGLKVLAARVAGVDMNGMRNLGDQLKGQGWEKASLYWPASRTAR